MRVLAGVCCERVFSYRSRSIVIPFAQVEPVVAVRQWVGPKRWKRATLSFRIIFPIRCWPIKIPIFKFQLKKSRARLQDSPTMLKSLNPSQQPVPSYLQRTAIKTSLVILILAFAGITQISAEQRTDKILIQGNSAGSQTVRTDPAGVTHVEYSYNDRGRGDHITATWKL